MGHVVKSKRGCVCSPKRWQWSTKPANASMRRNSTGRKEGACFRQTTPDAHQAEICFQQALDVAPPQPARSWELRAAMSFVRLWQQQGKRAEARDLLAPMYNWFTEGFDTADLQEAKALLDELA